MCCGSSHAAAVRLSQESDAVPIRLTDEQIRERYPWDYRELTRRYRERHVDFKVNDKYHRIIERVWKAISRRRMCVILIRLTQTRQRRYFTARRF